MRPHPNRPRLVTVAEAPGRFRLISPVTGSVVDRIPLRSAREIRAALDGLATDATGPEPAEIFEFLGRLRCQMQLRQGDLVERTVLETGFILEDCREMIQGTLDYLQNFQAYATATDMPHASQKWNHDDSGQRAHQIARRPLRCVAGIVPQNASVPLAVIMIASALYTGACVAVRPSLQCGSSGILLDELIQKSAPPAGRILVINCLADEFLEACYSTAAVDLIHYIGSNRYVREVMLRSFESRKMCLIDGQGNGLLYVDDSFPLEEAAALITHAATRYNGATCTSVNGVLASQSIHRPLLEALTESLRGLQVGDPRRRNTAVGPLFSRGQATGLRAALLESERSRLLCGGDVRCGFFAPAVFEGVDLRDPIVTHGFMGPAVWVQGLDDSQVGEWMRANQFPLSDTILSHREDRIHEFASSSRAARICVNVDPSIESMFEPWGGYPPSGLNPVCAWMDKYRQAYQIDSRAEFVPREARGAGR